MASEHTDVTRDVHALVGDLLPILAPGASMEEDEGIVVLVVGTAKARVSTSALLADCCQVPNHQWPELVDEWLRRMNREVATALDELELFGDVRSRLRLRIVPRMDPDLTEDLVTTSFGRYFDALVVIDHPEHGQPVTRAQASRLGLKDAGQCAIANVLEEEIPRFAVRDQPLNLDDTLRIVTMPGNPYVTCILVDLPRFLPEHCPYGALVAAPRYSSVLLYPVTSSLVLSFAPTFAQVATEMYMGADDPCTDEIFWWVDGKLLAIGLIGDTAGPSVRWPPELNELVSRLPPPERATRANE